MLTDMTDGAAKVLRILYLEDDAYDQELVVAALTREVAGCEFVFASNQAEFEAALGRGAYDLILSDFKIPSFDGLAALRLAQARQSEVPFIYVSGTIGEERAVETLRLGATDYVLKDRLDRLGPVVRRALQEAELRSAHQRAEEALKESSLLNQQIIASAREGIIVYDRELRYRLWNPFMEQMTGVKAEVVLGRKATELFPFLGSSDVQRSWARALAGEASPPGEFEDTIAATGRRGWVSYVDSPLRNARGEVTGILRVLRDITEQKHAHLELEENRRRLKALLDNLQDPVWLKDTQGRYLAFNAALAAFWDKKPEEILGKTLNEIAPAFAPELTTADQLVMQSKTTLRQEQHFRQGPLNTKWFDTIKSPILDQRGNVTGAVGVARDITERKLAEQDLRISEERFRSVWDCATEGMRLTDHAGRIIDVNKAFCELVGLPRERLLGQSFLVAYQEHPPMDNIDVYRQRFQSGQLPPFLATRMKLWNDRQVDLEVFPSFVQSGEQGKMILAIFHDVTERKALELQLRQSQKMDAIGHLAGGVAHDFNNLLAVIRGNADLLLMEPEQLSPAAKEGFIQIVKAAERAANLTRQLLAFSRKQVMQAQPLDLSEVVTELAKMLKRIIGENIQLETECASGLPAVQADAGMMEQVLVNLVVNARDAMPRGGRLQVSTELISIDEAGARLNPERRVGRFVRLCVRDTGTGIASEHLPHIFEPFFTTKEVGRGTGLGLATVYGIVKQHQGWVEVETRWGQGSSFKILLPVLCEQSVAPTARDEERVLRGGTETILLVEDEDSVRGITRRVLEAYGYRVLEAARAEEALELWNRQAQEIQLLMADMVLPDGVTGCELVEQLHGRRPELKVIFMSGYSADTYGKQTDFFRRTKSYFIQKPCSPRTLAEVTRRCLDGP